MLGYAQAKSKCSFVLRQRLNALLGSGKEKMLCRAQAKSKCSVWLRQRVNALLGSGKE